MDDSEAGIGALGEGSSGSARMPGESMDAYIARLTAMGLFGGDAAALPQVSANLDATKGALMPGFNNGDPSFKDWRSVTGQTSGTGPGTTTGTNPKNSIKSGNESSSMVGAFGGPDAQRILAQINAAGGNSGGVPARPGSGLPGADRNPAPYKLGGGGGDGSPSTQSGLGMWEPNNSSSGSSLPMPALSGGMTIAPQKTNSLAELLKGGGNGSAVPMKRGVIDRGTGVFDDPIGESFAPNRGRNALSDLLEKLQYVQPAYRNMPNPFAVDPSTYANGVGGRNYLEQLMRSRGGR